MSSIGLYSKAIGATVVAVLMAFIAARGLGSDGGALVTGTEWLTVIGVGLVSLAGVWAIPMGAIAGIGKAVTAALVALVGSLAAAAVWPPTTDGWLAAIIAALAALGVTYTIPNARRSDALVGGDGARLGDGPPMVVHQHYPPATPPPPA